MESSELLARLTAMRQTIRRRLIFYGVCAVLAGGVGSFLTIVTVDYLFWLPAFFRTFVAAVFFAGFVGALLHWIVAPLRSRIELDQIAARLERHFRHLDDRLTSAVNFLTGGDSGSRQLRSRVIAHTDQVVRDMPLESVLTVRPMVARGVMLLFASGVLAMVSMSSPAWVRTGLYRYLYPFGKIQWPRRVALVPLTGNEKVAMGESVELRMEVKRGLSDAQRAVVHLQDGRGREMQRAMQRGPHGVFSVTIDAVTTDLSYWFEAGDADTRDDTSIIHVVRRPEVVEALATVKPPPYAHGAAVRTHDLRDGPVSAMVGGSVTVAVRANKPIRLDSDPIQAGLQLDTGELVPFQPDPKDRKRLIARLDIARDVAFQMALVDDDGFENRGAASYRIVATPDQVPRVTMVEPQAGVELTPHASLRLRARVEDDFGIKALELRVERLPGDDTHTIPLTDHMVVSQTADRTEARLAYPWDVTSLSLSPGDVLRCTMLAKDNYPGTGSGGHVGRSAPFRIRIISPSEFDARSRDELALIEDRIRRVILDEAELHDRTQAFKQTDTPPTPLNESQREQTNALAGRQDHLVRRVDGLARRFAGLAQRMEQNRAMGKEERTRITSLGKAMQEIAALPMTAAGASLAAVGEPRTPREQQATLEKASQAEEESIRRLQSVIRVLAQWGDYQGLISKTRDLLDRQNELRMQTSELGKKTLGKTVDSLSPEQKRALDQNLRQQQQLVTEAGQLVDHMRELLASAGEKDSAAASSMDAALRAARSAEVIKRLQRAADAIASNRTAAATIDQKTAAAALEKMVSALHQRDERELARLRKEAQRTSEQIAALIEQQRDLRRATKEASLVQAGEGGFDPLRNQQRGLRRNTGQLGEELQDKDRLADAGLLLGQASGAMKRAEKGLDERKAKEAVASQEDALNRLADALAQAEKVMRETQEQALQRQLDDIREDLESIVSAQKQINGRLVELHKAIGRRGRLGRAEARKATKLAREQAGVRGQVEQVLPEMQTVPVYQWALQRVTGWMETSQQWFRVRKIDTELGRTTRRIVDELEKLIRAIDATKALPMEEKFAEAEQNAGGGGNGSAGSRKPVPSVAELLVLRAMQADINERTTQLHHSVDVDHATEDQLREWQVLAEDQTQVRRLAERVTARARHP